MRCLDTATNILFINFCFTLVQFHGWEISSGGLLDSFSLPHWNSNACGSWQLSFFLFYFQLIFRPQLVVTYVYTQRKHFSCTRPWIFRMSHHLAETLISLSLLLNISAVYFLPNLYNLFDFWSGAHLSLFFFRNLGFWRFKCSLLSLVFIVFPLLTWLISL